MSSHPHRTQRKRYWFTRLILWLSSLFSRRSLQLAAAVTPQHSRIFPMTETQSASYCEIGNHFHLESFGGRVRIEPHPSSDTSGLINVMVTGPKDRVDALKFAVSKDGEVTMEDPNAETSGGGVSIKTSNGRVSIKASGNSYVSNQPPMSAVVLVPIGTDVTIDRLYDDAEVGNTGGPLTATISGVSKLKVGCVGTTDLTLSGTGSCTIREVNGDLMGLLSGCGSLTVNGGEVNQLGLVTSGTGSATFNGIAQRAKLRASGCGNINVRRVVGKVTETRSGVADITVANRG
jgi:hypothetical protein